MPKLSDSHKYDAFYLKIVCVVNAFWFNKCSPVPFEWDKAEFSPQREFYFK